MYAKNDVIKPKRDFVPAGVELIMSSIEAIEPENNRVKIAKDERIPALRLPDHRDRRAHATGANARPGGA